MKQIYCFLLLLCPCFTKAQSTKQLSVGDKVPDIQFTQMVNSKSQTASLSQFKGKLVILDFWATWCSACIKNFPLLDSMQRLHTDKLQVILVNTATTHDTKEKITKLFSRLANTWGRQSVLPVVYTIP